MDKRYNWLIMEMYYGINYMYSYSERRSKKGREAKRAKLY